MPSFLEGPIRKWVGTGLKSGRLLLDMTIHRESQGGYTPGGGETVTVTDIPVPLCAFPDSATARFMANSNLQAGEAMLVVAQQPLAALGLTLNEDDTVTIRSKRWQLLEVTEDPAEATYVCRAKGVQ